MNSLMPIPCFVGKRTCSPNGPCLCRKRLLSGDYAKTCRDTPWQWCRRKGIARLFILWRLRVIVFLESWTFFYTGLITHHRHWMDSCGLVWHTCGWSHCIRFRMAMVVSHERLRIERLHRMKKPAFASTA